MAHRPGKQLLLKFGVFLLLGVVVNVAVAWGCLQFSFRPGLESGIYGCTVFGPDGTVISHGSCGYLKGVGMPFRTLSGSIDGTLRLALPGFTANTVFIAAVAWTLVSIPGKWRRFRQRGRIHRGCCPACGYLITDGVSAVCSECGSPLPQGFVPKTSIERDARDADVRVAVRIAFWVVAIAVILTLTAYVFTIWKSALPY
jgi:hypothetical protein